MTIRAKPDECPFWTILFLILRLFRVNRDDSRKINMIQLIPLFGPTHDIFLPSTFLNYFRLPSIYTSLYIDIHIEYTYINYVTSCAPSRRTTYILFAPLLPLPPLFPFLLPLTCSFTLTHSRCTHCVYIRPVQFELQKLKRKAINAKKFNVGETSRTVKY